jgi:tetratricopeptide (TPR) repeat protein
MRRILALAAALTLLVGAAPAFSASTSDAVKRNNFGADLIKQGRLDEAAAEFERALQADPRYGAAQLNLAYTYDRLGRVEAAIAAYRRSIELDPRSAYAYNNLGVLYDKGGEYDLAVEMYEQALRIEPNNPGTQKNLENARQNKRTVQEREAQTAAGLKQVEARPKDPKAAYEMARIYAVQGRASQAIEWLTKALELGFDDLEFMKADPALVGLRGDPRFGRLTQKP